MYNSHKVDAIVQARMTSSRLPGKVLLPLNDKPVLQHIIERLRRSEYVDDVIIATTTNESDNPIIELCDKLDCKYYRGSEDDVLSRVLEAAREFKTDIIVEITADCPLVCPKLVDVCIESLGDDDYCSNVIKRTFPRGFDVQVFWVKTLDRVNVEVDNPVDRQHVSTWIYRNTKSKDKYKKVNIEQAEQVWGNFENIRLTLDTEDDYELLNGVFSYFNDNEFTSVHIMHLFSVFPKLQTINSHIEQKSYEQELEEWYKENTQP